jgi:lipoyl(octanoyl) transferase
MSQTYRRNDGKPVEWAVSTAPVGYEAAVAAMQARAGAIADGEAGELIWLLEHPALYTAGVTAKPADLLTPGRFPVFSSARGGRFTYHGPGQRVAYVMLDLRERGRDVKAFVMSLEAWLIAALAVFGVTGEIRQDRVGVWVARGAREDKIAAIGVKLRRWVSFHGISLNVAPDLTHFDGIVPCGISDHGVTSLADLGAGVSMAGADAALRGAFHQVFGPTVDSSVPVVCGGRS